MICKHVYYTGRVQGVGFRYTAQRLAEAYPVAGYVRNLRDGAVELLVEGEPEQVEALLAALATHMGDYIQQANVREQTPSGCKGFTIRY